MSAFEIVLTAVLGFIIISSGIAIIIVRYYRRFIADRAMEHRVYNNSGIKGKIVFLGDSLTDFFPLLEYFHCGELHNRGVAGETTMDVIHRIDDVLCLEPKELFLQIGINDLITKPKTDHKQLVSRIMNIAKRFSDKGTAVHVISLYPVNRKATKLSAFVCRGAKNKAIMKINTILAEECTKAGLDFIDMYPLLLDEKGQLKREYTAEGLHLSAEGYRIVAKKLCAYIDPEAFA